jgi:hypothetical protein
MLKKVLILLLLAAAVAPAALAGEVILSADDISLPKDFSCGEAKNLLAGRYGLEVVYEPTPSAHSTLKVAKGGKPLCSVEGSGTSLHDKMATSKVRLFTRVDSNQVFYLPLVEAK